MVRTAGRTNKQATTGMMANEDAEMSNILEGMGALFEREMSPVLSKKLTTPVKNKASMDLFRVSKIPPTPGKTSCATQNSTQKKRKKTLGVSRNIIKKPKLDWSPAVLAEQVATLKTNKNKSIQEHAEMLAERLKDHVEKIYTLKKLIKRMSTNHFNHPNTTHIYRVYHKPRRTPLGFNFRQDFTTNWVKKVAEMETRINYEYLKDLNSQLLETKRKYETTIEKFVDTPTRKPIAKEIATTAQTLIDRLTAC